MPEKQSNLFTLAVEMSLDGIVIGDAAGNISFVNDALLKMFGSSDKNDLVGKHVLDFVVDSDKQRALECSLQSMKTGQGWTGQFTVITKDGSTLPIEITATPIKNKEGIPIAFIDIIRDVSQRVQTEAQLVEAHHKLELANEKLLVVCGLVRHDIANKLSTLNMNAYLAKKNKNLDGILEATQIACSQITRMINFSRDYEMLGREELGYVKVAEAFNEVIELFPNLNVQVINDCGGVQVLADSLLKELFYNLVDNTLKYGKTTKQIKLSYTAGMENLKLIYQDDGVGIPDLMKDKLFVKGFGKGSGLGLYLIKKTLEVYGWQIQETGTQGNGAKFEITIPENNYKLP